MSTQILLYGLVIFIFSVIRPFAYRPCAKLFPAEMSSAFTSTWLVVSIVLTFPFLSHLIDFYTLKENFDCVVISIVKGIALWAGIKYSQIVNRESTSSSVFLTFIVLALGALINNLFFKESLSTAHLMAMVSIGLLGVVFVFKGDIRRTSPQAKAAFVFVVFAFTFCMVSDHLVIGKIGWYAHLAISYIAMYLISCFRGISRTDYKNIFTNKMVIAAGLVYIAGEYVIIYSSINIMPVSFVGLFTRMAAAVVMVLSAIFYKEQSIKTQTLFASIAFCAAMVVIFVK